jgi:hypothetical protein
MPNLPTVDHSERFFRGRDLGIRRRQFCHARPLWSTVGEFFEVGLSSAVFWRRTVFIVGGVAESWKPEFLEWSDGRG